jgi:hypothetical protein
LISKLKHRYQEAVIENAESGGRGPATGRAFEEWVRENINAASEKGKVQFEFGPFFVDVAAPSRANPKAILELKVAPSLQDALAVRSLYDLRECKQSKVGFVVLTLRSHEREIRCALEQLKKESSGMFDYFVISDGWSETMGRIKNFLG